MENVCLNVYIGTPRKCLETVEISIESRKHFDYSVKEIEQLKDFGKWQYGIPSYTFSCCVRAHDWLELFRKCKCLKDNDSCTIYKTVQYLANNPVDENWLNENFEYLRRLAHTVNMSPNELREFRGRIVKRLLEMIEPQELNNPVSVIHYFQKTDESVDTVCLRLNDRDIFYATVLQTEKREDFLQWMCGRPDFEFERQAQLEKV